VCVVRVYVACVRCVLFVCVYVLDTTTYVVDIPIEYQCVFLEGETTSVCRSSTGRGRKSEVCVCCVRVCCVCVLCALCMCVCVGHVIHVYNRNPMRVSNRFLFLLEGETTFDGRSSAGRGRKGECAQRNHLVRPQNIMCDMNLFVRHNSLMCAI